MAPETEFQFAVAVVCVIPLIANPVGTPHPPPPPHEVPKHVAAITSALILSPG